MNNATKYQILRSGDLELIVTLISEEEILEHFGEESFEHLAYEHMLAGRLAKEIQSKKYIIPKHHEDPAATRNGLREWITRFHRYNKMELPKRFHKKNKPQLLGMYYGMLGHYQIKESDILSRDYSI
ncbi:MAG: hypothetical protein AABX64_03125 [Nanoarchaeota archaeon]